MRVPNLPFPQPNPRKAHVQRHLNPPLSETIACPTRSTMFESEFQIGNSDESLLTKRITAREIPPPEWQFSYFRRDITSGELEKLRQWVAAGAPPDTGEVAEVGEGPDPLISHEERKFWSFLAPSRPATPRVDKQDSVRTPIDTFLLRKLQEKELSFSPRADHPVAHDSHSCLSVG